MYHDCFYSLALSWRLNSSKLVWCFLEYLHYLRLSCRFYSRAGCSLLPNPFLGHASERHLLGRSRRRIPCQRDPSLLWDGNGWWRLDSCMELHFYWLWQFLDVAQRSHPQAYVAKYYLWLERSRFYYPTTQWNRLQCDGILLMETFWKANPHQKQHKQLDCLLT